MNKKRLDVLLVEKQFAKNRNEALSLIITKKVKVNTKTIEKAGYQTKETDKIEVEQNENKFVSRGGYKLLKAINEFKINLQEKICLDIGASTGGFTDCMLQNGAKKIYALDVGYGQLDFNLKNNKKVISLEKTNFRYWDGKINNEKIKFDFVSIDVSFISLKNILPNLNNLIKDMSFVNIIALIKPQFEIGKAKIKNGIVKNENDRQEVILDIQNFIKSLNFNLIGICESPIKGAKGNIEYLAYFTTVNPK